MSSEEREARKAAEAAIVALMSEAEPLLRAGTPIADVRELLLSCGHAPAHVEAALEALTDPVTGRIHLGPDGRRIITDPPAAEADFGPLVPLDEIGNLPPFPVEVLPVAFRHYVEEVAASRQVAPDLPAVLALSAAAIACARRYKVEIGLTHSEPANLYTLTLLEPGERKSAVFRDMLAPVDECERMLREAAAPEICRAEERRKCEEVRLAELRKRAGREDNPDRRAELLTEAEDLAAALTRIPTAPRLLTGDCTPERLVSLMAENGGRIAQADAEGGTFFNLIGGQYTKNGAGNFEVYLRAHPGDAIRVDRTTRPGECITEPALTLMLTGQPDLLRNVPDRERLRGRGLLARFLFALPAGNVGARTYQNREIAPTAKADYGRAVAALLAVPDPATPQNPTAYHPLQIKGEALDVWATFADETERNMGPDGVLAHARDWGAKLAGAVARIAGLLHVMADATEPNIPPATVAAAWAVGQYFQSHALGAFALMEADPRLVLARRVLGWIRRHHKLTFKLSELFNARVGGATVTMADDLAPGVLVLIDRGYCRPLPAQAIARRGRKPSPAFAVNPAVHEAKL
ncbi:MAG: DUF3987 domain-containing protein [Lentisphaerae bacterium]|nr:DUF3987 domain-containing protein [Lentisphaerota bacterium]